MAISKEILDELLKGVEHPEDLPNADRRESPQNRIPTRDAVASIASG